MANEQEDPIEKKPKASKPKAEKPAEKSQDGGIPLPSSGRTDPNDYAPVGFDKDGKVAHKPVRKSSPSIIRALVPCCCSCVIKAFANVDLPAPERPVIQMVWPISTPFESSKRVRFTADTRTCRQTQERHAAALIRQTYPNA